MRVPHSRRLARVQALILAHVAHVLLRAREHTRDLEALLEEQALAPSPMASAAVHFGSTTSSTSLAFTTPMLARSLTVPASNVTITNVPVTLGLNNDTMTEITSGIRQQDNW